MDSSVAFFFTGALVAGGIYWFLCVLGPAERKGKRALDLSGGSVSAEKVQDTFPEKEIESPSQRDQNRRHVPRERDRNSTGLSSAVPKRSKPPEKVPDFVNTFYNLVTDIYEWGWGQSSTSLLPSEANPTVTPRASTKRWL